MFHVLHRIYTHSLICSVAITFHNTFSTKDYYHSAALMLSSALLLRSVSLSNS